MSAVPSNPRPRHPAASPRSPASSARLHLSGSLHLRGLYVSSDIEQNKDDVVIQNAKAFDVHHVDDNYIEETHHLQNIIHKLDDDIKKMDAEKGVNLKAYDEKAAKQYEELRHRHNVEQNGLASTQNLALHRYMDEIEHTKIHRDSPKWSEECRQLMAIAEVMVKKRQFQSARQVTAAVRELQKREQAAFNRKTDEKSQRLLEIFQKQQDDQMKALQKRHEDQTKKFVARRDIERERLKQNCDGGLDELKVSRNMNQTMLGEVKPRTPQDQLSAEMEQWISALLAKA